MGLGISFQISKMLFWNSFPVRFFDSKISKIIRFQEKRISRLVKLIFEIQFRAPYKMDLLQRILIFARYKRLYLKNIYCFIFKNSILRWVIVLFYVPFYLTFTLIYINFVTKIVFSFWNQNLSAEGLNAKHHIHGDSGLKCGLRK